ncbi:L-lysine 2-3-aminomutase [Penicillium fimorum]|uniref:L-lysine 2-3-aminomutase n=1 Tax=Penicillium fimorum TaxID=1882269 RepID=A0A9X0C837_9EURO|nr:L-lysine 2-3-aminomutase [Penicillium fimorum]
MLRFAANHQRHSIIFFSAKLSTYDHRVWKTGLPVRSAVLKPHAGELVVGWVTTSESSLFSHTNFVSKKWGQAVVFEQGGLSIVGLG